MSSKQAETPPALALPEPSEGAHLAQGLGLFRVHPEISSKGHLLVPLTVKIHLACVHHRHQII